MVRSRPTLALLALSLTVGLSACRAIDEARRAIQFEGEQALEYLLGETPPDTTAYLVYLVGDAGAPWAAPGVLKPALQMLRAHLDEAGPRSAVVFLGDNIYPSGLAAPEEEGHVDGARALDGQLEALGDYAGRVVFVAGNHDWGRAGLGGDRARVRRQEAFLEDAMGGDVFLPDDGHAGPATVALTDSLALVAINTQWWLEPAAERAADYPSHDAFLAELDSALARAGDREVLVVAHHPLVTNGPHGGYFPSRRGLGALTTTLRTQASAARHPLGRQDVFNPVYQELIRGLYGVFEGHDRLIYAAGHEHSLQYFRQGRQHYIVSGAASKQSYVAQGRGETFARQGYGFAVLRYYGDGSVWLEFWAPPDEAAADAAGTAETPSPLGERVFQARIEAPRHAAPSAP